MGDTTIKASRSKYQKLNPLSSTPAVMGSTVTQDRFKEAVVIDTITNDSHLSCTPDGYNVGCIKYRIMSTQASRDTAGLNWAYPLAANTEDFPLKNEIVLVFQSLNKVYYMPKMSIGNSPSNQAFFDLETEMGPTPSAQTSMRNLNESRYRPRQPGNTNANNKLGEYFTEQPKVLHLRHWEGDKVVEGRSGHSIRFGTAWKTPTIHRNVFQSLTIDQAPNLLLRVGPDIQQTPVPNSVYGRTVEDINEDKSSLWLVSDQVVKIKLATEGTSYNGRSITNFPNPFSGNQIILNSGRVIINSKSDKVLVHAFDGIHLSTLKDGTWDAEQDFIVRTGRRVSLMSPKIHVGSASDTADRMMLGDTFIEALKLLVQAHITNQATYAMSPVGPCTLSPAVEAAWKAIQRKMDTFLSQDNYVSRTNQR